MFDYKDTVERLIRQEIERGTVNGANILVLQHGKEILNGCYGYADREKELPMKRDTIFRMFSMSKPVTAVAAMLLAERGELDMWDPVSRYLPDFHGQTVWDPVKKTEVSAQRDITIWDCLNMTSGVTYPDMSTEPGSRMDKLFRELIERRINGDAPDTQEYMRRIARIPLVFQPGERWLYGLSADILGAVIEKCSGKKYGQFLQEEIFEPLKMLDTGFYVPEEKRSRFAQNYEWDEEKQCLIPYTGCNLGECYEGKPAFESGGAGLVSTIEDYSHFSLMLVQGGQWNGVRILGQKTVEFMSKNHLTSKQRESLDWDSTKGYGYGCLMRVMEDPGEAGMIAAPGEYGWDGWTGNYMTVDPADDMVFLYFIQRCGAGTTALVRKLRNVTYAALR